MKLYVQTGDEPPKELAIGDGALRLVRASFNPSGNEGVDRAKLLCAALIEEANNAASSEGAGDEERRCAAIARTQVETGAMFIVKALTAQPPAPKTEDPATQPAS